MLLTNTDYDYARVYFKTLGVNQETIGGIINIGSITLSKENRRFVFDVCETQFVSVDNDTNVDFECKLEEDKEIFNDKNDYTLTVEDLLSKDLKAEFYCVSDSVDITFRIENPLLIIYSGGKELNIPLTLED